MGERTRARDWSTSPLGEPSTWSQSLKTAAGIVLNSLQPMFLVWGPELAVIHNDAFAPILGAKQSAEGTPLPLLLSGDWGGIHALVQKALAGEAVRVEHLHLILRRNGDPEDAWFNVSCSPLRDDSGAVAGVFGVCSETTDAMRTRSDMQEGTERLHLAIEATGIGIWDVDARTGERRWSDEFRRIIGIGPDVTPDQNFFSSLIHPDDRAWVNERYAGAYKPEVGDRYEAEFRIRRHNDGEERWVLTTGRITFDARGAAVRGIGTILDITRMKSAEAAARQSKAQFHQLAEALPQQVWVMRQDGTALYLNRRLRKYHGFDIGPEIEARSSTIHPDDKERVWPIREAAMAAGKAFQLDVRTRRHDGSYRWHRMSVVPLRSDGAGYLWVGTATDIDEMRRAEEHQRLLINELNHRVKNTLATVQSIAAQTLRNALTIEGARDAIEARLVALSRAHDVLTRENWDGAELREIVANSVEPYRSQGEDRLSWEGPDTRLSPRMALALAMALQELATNAVKYGALSNTSGKIRISWGINRSVEPNRLQLRWEETGGPLVTIPARRGFGTRLIERSLAHDLQGIAHIDFAPAGIVCTVDAPIA